MSWEKFTKECVGITRGHTCHSKSWYEQDSIGRLCRRIPSPTWRRVTSVKASATSYNSHRRNLHQWGPPWPFTQWGLDIIGPFPMAIQQLKFLVIGIDYFTKWVEAKPLAIITKKNVRSFIWKSIVCRFGIHRVFVSDNDAFRDFRQQLGSRTTTPLSPTLRPTDKLRLQINPYLRWSRLSLRGQSVYGWMNYSVSCGYIEQRLA